MSSAIRVQMPGTDEDCCAWSVLRGLVGHHNVLPRF
jgi:hypothetical protein